MSEEANSRSRTGPRRSRRHVLAACAAALLAGCPSESDPTPTGERDQGGEESTQEAATETQVQGMGGDTATQAQTGDDGTPAGAWADDGTSLDQKDGGPPAVTSGWATFGHDLANTGYPATDAPTTDDLGLYWRQYIDGQYSVPQPAVVDETVYTGSGEYVYALDVADGSERWSARLGKYTHNVSPTVSDGRLFVAAREVTTTDQVRKTQGTFYALDATDGSVLWDVDSHVMAGATVHDGTVYLPGTPTDPEQRGVLRALDAETGDEEWRFVVEGQRDGAETTVYATPAIDQEGDGTLYLTAASTVDDDERGFLYALDPESGTERWRLDTESGVHVAPVCADRRVYTGDAAGRLYAVSTGGVEVWRKAVGDGGIDTTPVVAPEREAICASSLGRFASLKPSTGEVNWHIDIRDVRRSGLAAAGDRLYVGGSPFLIVDLQSGEVLREVPVDGVGGAYGQPVVSDGAVYVSSCIKQGEDLLYDNYVYVMG